MFLRLDELNCNANNDDLIKTKVFILPLLRRHREIKDPLKDLDVLHHDVTAILSLICFKDTQANIMLL